jgi:hypothetical protein
MPFKDLVIGDVFTLGKGLGAYPIYIKTSKDLSFRLSDIPTGHVQNYDPSFDTEVYKLNVELHYSYESGY